MGTIIGAEDCTIQDMDILSVTGTEILLLADDVTMALRRVRFLGMSDIRGAQGIVSMGDGSTGLMISECDFFDLSVGVSIFDGVPTIRRCLFVDPSTAAILVQESAQLNSDEGLSSAGNAQSGFNTFRFSTGIANPVPSPTAVINETDQILKLENNDWETDDDAAVEALIAGQSDFEPKLAAGSAVLASSVFCTVWADTNQARIPNVTVSLNVSSFDPITENTDGVYAFPSVLMGEYTVVCEAAGFEDQEFSFMVGAGEIKSVTIPMPAESTAAEGEGEGEGEGETPTPTPTPTPTMDCHSDGGGLPGVPGGDFLLIGILLLILLRFGLRGAHSAS